MYLRLFFVVVLASMTLIVGFNMVFTIPDQPQLVTMTELDTRQSVRCMDFENPKALDNKGQLDILVWNIYKQNRDNWQQVLEKLSTGKQLLILQEASMTDEFKHWLVEGQWFGNQVRAFKALGSGAGVINIAKQAPIRACAYTQTEPWLRLPKSALYSDYNLSNGQVLVVINIHAINFTLGTEEYTTQLTQLEMALNKHKGPILFAGDFNSWSEERLNVIQQTLRKAELIEVKYDPDQRTQFLNGLPLDHVFYRGLILKSAEAPESDASDHNPLLVSFRLME